MKKSKRLTSKSGITIPKDMRAKIGFFPGMAVDMETVQDGTILIKPHVPICWFCGSPDQVTQICTLEMCSVCRKSFREELVASGE